MHEDDGRPTLEFPLPKKPSRHPARSKYPPRPPSDPALMPLYERGQLLIHRQKFIASPIGEIGTDPDGYITEANPAAIEIFGRSAADLYDTHIFQYIDDEYGTPMSEAVGKVVKGVSVDRHVFVKRPGGEMVSCLLSVIPIFDEGPDGEEKTIIRVIGFLRDQTELEKNSKLDRKTGLLNEETFLERVEEHKRLCRKSGLGMAVAFVDMNKMGALNKRFDHSEADRAIVKMGAQLSEAIFKHDFAGHPHGDEFTILFVPLTRKGAEHVARKLVEYATFEVDMEDGKGKLHTVPISGTIGLCWRSGSDIHDAKAMIKLADHAMRAAKEKGLPFILDLED